MARLSVANSDQKAWARHSYILWFGACGTTRILVYADNLEDALEIAVGFAADQGWRGLFIDHGDKQYWADAFADACKDLGLEKEPSIATDEDAYWRMVDAATEDLTYTETGYVPSWEWGIVAEDPDKQEIISIAKGV